MLSCRCLVYETDFCIFDETFNSHNYSSKSAFHIGCSTFINTVIDYFSAKRIVFPPRCVCYRHCIHMTVKKQSLPVPLALKTRDGTPEFVNVYVIAAFVFKNLLQFSSCILARNSLCKNPEQQREKRGSVCLNTILRLLLVLLERNLKIPTCINSYNFSQICSPF